MDLRNLTITSLLLTTLALAGCGGGGSGSKASDSSSGAKFISGMVIDGNTGIPIENALITTTPPTEVRLTDREGIYLVRDNVFVGNIYDVTARQIGYTSDTRTISVNPDGFSGADFSIVTSVNGLVSSVSTLEIAQGDTNATFLLSSTLADTPFSFQTTDPAFRVVPAQGTLFRNQHIVIDVQFAPQAQQTGRVAGQLVANAENGGTGIQVNVIGNVPPAELQRIPDPYMVLVDENSDLITGISGDPTDTSTGSSDTSDDPPNDDSNNLETVPDQGDIAFGNLIVGRLDSLSDIDIYQFEAAGNDELLVQFSQQPGSHPFFTLQLELRDSAGSASLKTVTGDNGILTATIPSNGRYSVWLSNPDQSIEGNYEFTLQRINNPGEVNTVNYGSTTHGILDGPADVDVHVFSARAGDELVANFAQAAGSHPFFTLQVELRDGRGAILSTTSGDRGVLTGNIATDGQHYLWISNPDYTLTGEYEFTLQRAN